VKLSQLRVVLQKILGNFSQPAGFLDALFVIDIHVEVGAVLLGQRDALLIDHGRVLDRGHAGPDRILDALGRVRMGLDSQSEVAGFIHRGLQLSGVNSCDFGLLPWVSTAPLERTLMWSAPSCTSWRILCRTSHGLSA
jgi:hypothetical protein